MAVDIEYHRGMLELCSRVNAKEVVVGWYSTGRGVSSSDALIQDFFGREAPGAVHITVDTELGGLDGHGGITAYVGTTLALGDRQVAAQFHQVQLDLRMMEAERIGFENLKKTVVERVPSDLDGLEATVGRLAACLDTVFHHVDAVLDGRIEADGSIGRYLAYTVAALPKASPDGFQTMLQDGIQVGGTATCHLPPATWLQATGYRLQDAWIVSRGDVASRVGAGSSPCSLPRQPHPSPARPGREAQHGCATAVNEPATATGPPRVIPGGTGLGHSFEAQV